MLVSWVVMPCTTHSPMPCQPKIFSTNTAPVTDSATLYANSVAIGISAVRRPCLNSACRG